MGRIRILSDNVANKIAAGEVVERPASVVKELLENSLDAGATEFRLEAEAGGRRLLRLSDNGIGMMRDDALLAFERHATSKLSDVKDLLSIATLGFRGEALPSIASVSRLTLETRPGEDQVGTMVEIAGGRILKCDDAALPTGTTITVRDLFYNVPARKKFLRSEQTEIAHIASLITHYSLAHPAKSFVLRHNNVDLLNVTPVPSLRERVFQVFGSHALEDLVDLGDRTHANFLMQQEEENQARRRLALANFRLRGFVSGPQVQKLNRNSIYLFVNGRLIRDRLLMHALTAAYHNLMPPACYPFALLFLECDAEEVDVNVHPSKTEVRFRHGSAMHDFVRDTIREVLIAQRPAARMPSPAQPAAELPYSEFTQRLQEMSFLPSDSATQAFGAAADPSAMPEFTLRREQSPPPRFNFTESTMPWGLAFWSAAAVVFRESPNQEARLRVSQFPIRTATSSRDPPTSMTRASMRCATFVPWVRSMTALSSPPDATASGSSISTSRTNASCSKKFSPHAAAARPKRKGCSCRL